MSPLLATLPLALALCGVLAVRRVGVRYDLRPRLGWALSWGLWLGWWAFQITTWMAR